MSVAIKKYTLPELKLGMEVKIDELSNILDTYIILVDVYKVGKDLAGKIGFIGEELTAEVSKLRSPDRAITSVYNNSTEIGDDVTYDE